MDIDSSSKPGLSAMMPLAAGLLGVLIGVIALFMSLSNSSKVAAIQSSVNDLQGTADSIKSMASDITSVKQKVDLTANKTDSVITTVKGWLDDFSKGATSAFTAVDGRLAKLEARGSTAATTGTTHAGGDAPVTSAGGEYKIAPGDTLTSIAAKFHVSLAALEAANPTVTPTKMQVGQVLTIPPSAPASGTSRPAPRSATASATGPASAVSTP